MLFASTALAARVERADCGLLTDAALTIARLRPGTDVVVRTLAGGVAIFAGEGSPLNKVAGLGFRGPVPADDLDEIERLYHARGVPVQVELASLADSSVAPMLTARGYALMGFENVLGRTLTGEETAGATPPDVSISVSDDQDFATWLDTVVTGFASPDLQGVPSHESFPRDLLERVMGDMSRAPGFVRYLAFRGGEPAGGGSMRIGEGVAQMCGASTIPTHRRRGVQSALLSRRIADAAQAGCDVVVVTTQPGSKSQENVQRRGFQLLYVRAVLVKEPPGS